MQLPISCAGAVELVRAERGVDRVADGDLVADDEDPPLRSREQALVGVGVAPGRVVQALAAREGVRARVLRLPGPVVVDRPALELADVDVVEQRLDLDGDRRALRARSSPSARLRPKRVCTQRSSAIPAS